jgi:tRNA pseudouridine38-40 synthase
MNSKRYLIKIQYLGHRYHGVQKQNLFKSIQGVVEDSLAKTFSEVTFKTRFASRTDARVSAIETYFVLMFPESVDCKKIQEAMAMYIPADLKILDIKAVDNKFTMLKAVEFKEYHYYFSSGGDKNHPFSAPFVTQIKEELDIELMKKGALAFVGTHNFINYCYRPKENTPKIRNIFSAKIVENTIMSASFFPEKSYVLKVKSASFMRGQMRLMMGALFRLGLGEMSLDELERSLNGQNSTFIKWQAPASGLILHSTQLK